MSAPRDYTIATGQTNHGSATYRRGRLVFGSLADEEERSARRPTAGCRPTDAVLRPLFHARQLNDVVTSTHSSDRRNPKIAGFRDPCAADVRRIPKNKHDPVFEYDTEFDRDKESFSRRSGQMTACSYLCVRRTLQGRPMIPAVTSD